MSAFALDLGLNGIYNDTQGDDTMNSKLQKLAAAATSRIDPTAHDGACEHFDRELFAELIVKELVAIVVNQGIHMRINQLAVKLQQHFESDK
jgi:uncharacterized protein (DUF2164 family)